LRELIAEFKHALMHRAMDVRGRGEFVSSEKRTLWIHGLVLIEEAFRQKMIEITEGIKAGEYALGK